MEDTLKKICNLQPQYSHKNTPEMKERGRLINTVLKSELSNLKPAIAPSLGSYGRDYAVSSSDGQGNKVEAPWVRFCSDKMSPNAQNGYYVVIHFKKDGTGLYLTLGCGSSTLKNGSIVTLSKTLLRSKTNVAKNALLAAHGSIEKFNDIIDLGGRTPLVKSFENATVIAKFISKDEIDGTDFETLLYNLGSYLKTIYEAVQSTGADLTEADQSQLEIENAIRPKRSRKGAQGFGLNSLEKRAVEQRAMKVVNDWLIAEGYQTKDTSSNESFDFLAKREGSTIFVEVKGTTSADPSSILMTANEVNLHKEKKGETALAIVSSIKLTKGETPIASEGQLDMQIGWDIDQWERVPTAFRLERT